jgi:hypothetical protein
MTADRDSRAAGAHARYGYGSVIPRLGRAIVRIEDESEREAFIQRVVAEFLSGQAPFAFLMYVIPLQTIITELLGIR